MSVGLVLRLLLSCESGAQSLSELDESASVKLRQSPRAILQILAFNLLLPLEFIGCRVRLRVCPPAVTGFKHADV